jgi:hypothetical protein
MYRIWFTYLAVAILICGFSATNFGAGSGTLRWNANQVDADLDNWPMEKVLEHISAQTGWQIYTEPELRRSVSLRFKELPVSEALVRLLGDLNFALLPRSNGPAQLMVYKTSLQEATRLIAVPESAKAGPAKRIPNELIVTLKPGAKQSIDDLAKRLGAKVVSSADDLNSYRLQFKDEASADAARELLSLDSDVASTDSNYLISPPSRIEKLQMSSPPPFRLKPKVSTDGSHIIVGLIDTGLQALPAGMNEFLLPGIQVAGVPGSTSSAMPTHGTTMAETVLRGLSVGAEESGGSTVRVLPVDVYGPNAETTTFDVAKGVYAAVNAGATVINLSMGGEGDSKFLADLIKDTYKQGVLFFGAAGNTPTTSATYPAAYSDVVAVTAGDRKGNIASYANRGSFVDVIAPGMSVVEFGGQSYLISGTSAATAYVSGTAAAVRSSGKDAAQAEKVIRESLAIKKP